MKGKIDRNPISGDEKFMNVVVFPVQKELAASLI